MTYRYREDGDRAINLCGNKCVVCGWNEKDYKGRTLLIRAHIRPFDNNKNFDIYKNIIALCPNHHEEFDAGNFTIDYDKMEVIHIDVNHKLHGSKLVGNIKFIDKRFIIYHNVRIFKASLM